MKKIHNRVFGNRSMYWSSFVKSIGLAMFPLASATGIRQVGGDDDLGVDIVFSQVALDTPGVSLGDRPVHVGEIYNM